MFDCLYPLTDGCLKMTKSKAPHAPVAAGSRNWVPGCTLDDMKAVSFSKKKEKRKDMRLPNLQFRFRRTDISELTDHLMLN
jgi:hypothetical protein